MNPRTLGFFGVTFAAGLLIGSVLSPPAVSAADQQPIEIATIQHTGPVDFEKEILPLFRRNCLACHNGTEAESDLVLETPQSILKGGSQGASIVAGKGLESLLLKVTARLEDPAMPPADNSVGAKPLTPQELGLLKLWIDEGGKGEVRGISGAPNWQPLPAGVNPIYTVAISSDAQFAAAGRANQIFVYHAPSKRELGRLSDPAIVNSPVYNRPGVAFFDVVQSLAFSPNGDYLAAGGYRTVKVFERPKNIKQAELEPLDSPARCVAISPDGHWGVFGQDNGKIRVVDLKAGHVSISIAGHGAAVTGVAISADGSKLASASQDSTWKLWSLANFQQMGQGVASPTPIQSVAFVADGQQVATAHADNLIRIWDVAATAATAPATPVKELSGHGGPVTSVAPAAANGSQLLSGSHDGTVRLWDVAGGKEIRAMNHGGPVEAIAVRPDFMRFASASSNNTAKLWNAADGAQVIESKGDFNTRLTVEKLVRASELAKRRVDLAKADLDAANKRREDEAKNQTAAEEAKKKAAEELIAKTEAAKQPVADKEVADKALVDAQAAHKKALDDQQTATTAVAKADEAAKLAQEALAAAVQSVASTDAVLKFAAEVFPKSQEAAKAAPENKTLAELVPLLGKLAQDSEAGKKAADESKVAADQAVVAADAGKKAADEAKRLGDEAVTKADADLKQADEKAKQAAAAAQKAVDEKNAAERNSQAAEKTFTRAGEAVAKAITEIATAEAAHKAEEGKQQQAVATHEAAAKTLPETEKPLRTLAFSSDNRTLAIGGDDQKVHTFDAETGAPIASFAGGATVTAVGFTADQDVLAAGADSRVVVWDVNPDWTLVRTIGSPDDAMTLVDRVTALGFSHDGKWLATGSGEPSRSGQLKIWSLETGQLVREIPEPHSDTIFAVEFSPEDTYLATCGADRFMKVFDTKDGKFVRGFEGHTHHVLGVAWSPDGRTLATCGADKVIKVWNFLTGDQQRTIAGFTKELTSIKFLTDGVSVAASCGDNNVHIKRTDNGGDVRALGGGTDYMYSVGVSDDGKTFVAGGQDSIVRLWNDQGQVVASFAPPATN